MTFIVALIFSYLGSIPPGMINISVLQYALQSRKDAALSFIVACVLVEFVYALIAVRFQIFITENTAFNEYFQLITATVLIGLGLVNLFRRKQERKVLDFGEKRNAFKRGTLISLGNTLAIPFWLAVTTYLQSLGWISLENFGFWAFIFGIALGTFLLLITILFLASRYSIVLNNHFLVYKAPGFLFLFMGGWSFYQWIITLG